ncbi:MAG: OsmC family peroxiredoxin [Proteobacteria bacterium]|nr:MAG: OsmC family peroxiredoxin [Pseudomonadota bacterium]
MQDLPHRYTVSAVAGPEGDVSLRGDGLTAIASAPPTEFGGPGDRWSPEMLLAASVADCFVLSFKAIARASKFQWDGLKCDVEGVLERDEGKIRFTRFIVRAKLDIGVDANEDRARRLLEKAKSACLVTSSLSAETVLEAAVNKTG